MTDRTLRTKAKALADINAQIAELEKQQAKLKADITAEMEAREVDEIKAGNFLARWKSITSNRFDSKAFKGAYSALYEQYTKSLRSQQHERSPYMSHLQK